MIFLVIRLCIRRLTLCFSRLIADGVFGMAGSRSLDSLRPGLMVRPNAPRASPGDRESISQGRPLIQVPQPLGDVEVGVVVGGDLVVVLLGRLRVAQRLGDPAEAVVQGVDRGQVVGSSASSGLERVLVAPLGQLQDAVGLEPEPSWSSASTFSSGAVRACWNAAIASSCLPALGQALPELELEVQVVGLHRQAGGGTP